MAGQDVITQSGNDEKLSKKELKKAKKAEKKANKSGGKGGFIKTVLIILILLGAIFALLYFNVLNLRSTYIDSMIVGTPFESVFPSADSSQTSPQQSKSELLAEIDSLNREIESLTKENEDLLSKNDLFLEQISQLEPLAQEQLQFKEDKELFDTMIAEGDSEAFKNFYENMYPDTARSAYENLIIEANTTKEITDYTATFTSMDPNNAGKILEAMSVTDLNLVVSILNNMNSGQSGEILSQMSAETAANVARRMAPTGY